jgi:ATP phosphoribosyltransferase regulatory subunit HisZ
MTTNTPPVTEPVSPQTAEVLQQTLLTGFVFNVNLLMQQMVANQHALQQILVASTAKAVAEMTNPENTNDASVMQQVDVVLKAIQESSSGYITLIREMAVEAENLVKMVKNN